MRGSVWQTAVFLLVLMIFTACTPAEESSPNAVNGAENEISSSVEETAVIPETPTEEVIVVNLEDLGPAPEIENEIWLNSAKPLPLSSQKGKVVLLEFWTFG